MTDREKQLQKKEAELEKGVERTRAKRVYTPPVDIIEQKEYIILLADMPGVDENSVKVTLDKDMLTIHGDVEPEVHKNHRLVISEYGIGDYKRTFALSNEIDREKIKASMKDGVLRLTLPKAATARTRKIPVTGNA
jgi:HSP20 family molecular chaperone IbpA